jgi:hypothetical protein
MVLFIINIDINKYILNLFDTKFIINFIDTKEYQKYSKSIFNDFVINLENIKKNKELRKIFLNYLVSIKKENLLNILLELDYIERNDSDEQNVNIKRIINLMTESDDLISDIKLKDKLITKSKQILVNQIDINIIRFFDSLKSHIINELNTTHFNNFQNTTEYKSLLYSYKYFENNNFEDYFNMIYGLNSKKMFDSDDYNSFKDVSKKDSKFDFEFQCFIKEILFNDLNKDQIDLFLNCSDYKFGTFEFFISNIM